MKYTKDERLEIGRRIYNGEISRYDASKEYDIDYSTARDYMRLYRDTNNLPPKIHYWKKSLANDKREPRNFEAEILSIKDYEKMSKEELIEALVLSNINKS